MSAPSLSTEGQQLVNLSRDVDEVWLALTQSEAAFRRNGHTPIQAVDACVDCHALHLIEQAKKVYLNRHKETN